LISAQVNAMGRARECANGQRDRDVAQIIIMHGDVRDLVALLVPDSGWNIGTIAHSVSA